MPTPKQIYEMREAQQILGLSDDEFYCRDFSREPITERNYKPRKTLERFTGEIYAYHFINRETGEHKEYLFKSRGKK